MKPHSHSVFCVFISSEWRSSLILCGIHSVFVAGNNISGRAQPHQTFWPAVQDLYAKHTNAFSSAINLEQEECLGVHTKHYEDTEPFSMSLLIKSYSALWICLCSACNVLNYLCQVWLHLINTMYSPLTVGRIQSLFWMLYIKFKLAQTECNV